MCPDPALDTPIPCLYLTFVIVKIVETIVSRKRQRSADSMCEISAAGKGCLAQLQWLQILLAHFAALLHENQSPIGRASFWCAAVYFSIHEQGELALYKQIIEERCHVGQSYGNAIGRRIGGIPDAITRGSFKRTRGFNIFQSHERRPPPPLFSGRSQVNDNGPGGGCTVPSSLRCRVLPPQEHSAPSSPSASCAAPQKAYQPAFAIPTPKVKAISQTIVENSQPVESYVPSANNWQPSIVETSVGMQCRTTSWCALGGL
mmetsp:Transcript_399/g.791  ORF Transcript_399/g.791 Transcript_399/m.791 type:complete len:260 (+) Transcript_399:528-1307(+)